MAHSWVQMFDSQYEAFKTYCQIYPHNATLLVDTYNVPVRCAGCHPGLMRC